MASKCRSDRRRPGKRSIEETKLQALLASVLSEMSDGKSRKRRRVISSSPSVVSVDTSAAQRRRRCDDRKRRRDDGKHRESRSRHGRGKNRGGRRANGGHCGDEAAGRKSASITTTGSTTECETIDIASDDDDDVAKVTNQEATEEFPSERKPVVSVKSEPTFDACTSTLDPGDALVALATRRSKNSEEIASSTETPKKTPLIKSPAPEGSANSKIAAKPRQTTSVPAPVSRIAASAAGSGDLSSKISKISKNPEKSGIFLDKSAETAHATLVNAWRAVVVGGLSREAHAELLAKYEASGDFGAPLLNLGLKSLLGGAEIVRDEEKMARQNQLGGLMSAAAASVRTILAGDGRSSELARLADATIDTAMILGQVHFSLSVARRSRVVEALGAAGRVKLAGHAGDWLFSQQEVEAVERAIELRRMNEAVESRLAKARKKELMEEEAEKAKEEAEKAKEEEEKTAKEKAEKKAQEEAEKKAKEEAEEAKEEAEKAKEEAEKAKEEAEKAKEEAEKAKEEAEKAKEEAEKAKEEAEKKAKEEAEKKAKEEAEKKAKENAEEEASRLAAENEAVAPGQEEQEAEAAFSPRFGGSQFSRCTPFQAKLERVKNEKFKTERNSQFVPNSDFPGMAEVTRMARRRQGFAEIAIPIAVSAYAPSTLKGYERHIAMWWDFSHRESVDTFAPALSDVMQFFAEYSQNGATIATLNSARSALSYLIDKGLGSNEYLSMVFKGFSKADPAQPKTKKAAERPRKSQFD